MRSLDHAGGLLTVIDRYDVAAVLDAAQPTDGALYDTWEAVLRDSGASITTADRQPMAGRTDSWIVSDAIAAHGIAHDSAALARFHEIYLRRLAEEIDRPGDSRKGVMPGIRELLDALAANDAVYLALLTGNYEAAARIKLEYFNLWDYFRCGAFGDAAPDRNGLLPRALRTVAACGGPSFAAADAVVIGDTPLDVECAKFSNARSIGVATGLHSIEELRVAGADVVFADLSDTRNVLRALNV